MWGYHTLSSDEDMSNLHLLLLDLKVLSIAGGSCSFDSQFLLGIRLRLFSDRDLHSLMKGLQFVEVLCVHLRGKFSPSFRASH